jgi:hypothetical protein
MGDWLAAYQKKPQESPKTQTAATCAFCFFGKSFSDSVIYPTLLADVMALGGTLASLVIMLGEALRPLF